MEFLAFPVAGIGVLILWAAGVPLLGAIFLGPAVALGLFAVGLQLLWPNTPVQRKKPRSATDIRIARRPEERPLPKRAPQSREDDPR